MRAYEAILFHVAKNDIPSGIWNKELPGFPIDLDLLFSPFPPHRQTTPKRTRRIDAGLAPRARPASILLVLATHRRKRHLASRQPGPSNDILMKEGTILQK